MVAYFRPFLEHLVELELSRKTIRKPVNNLWLLGGEITRDLHATPALRKVPVETLVFNMIEDGGPILYHNDSEEQQRSLESTCRKFCRFLKRGAKLRSNQEALEMTFPPHGSCCWPRSETIKASSRATH